MNFRTIFKSKVSKLIYISLIFIAILITLNFLSDSQEQEQISPKTTFSEIGIEYGFVGIPLEVNNKIAYTVLGL